MKLVSKKKLKERYYRYDLSIKNTHNFVSCGAVVHNTSAHLKFSDKGELTFFSGGEKHDKFVNAVKPLINMDADIPKGIEMTVYGEAYGGKCQGMSDTYGKELKFCVFDVKIGDIWLDVPNAENVAKKLGLEFVDYVKVPSNLECFDIERDKPSAQAIKNGCGYKQREGVVIRPLAEYTRPNGKRVIVKHKGDNFRETRTPRQVSPEQLKVLSKANEVANEWVTHMRLEHVLDKLDGDKNDMSIMSKLGRAMVKDVGIESEGEVIWSKEVERAIVKRTAEILKERISSFSA